MKTTYKEKLESPKWQRKRLEKMQEAEWKCEVCGDSEEKMNVHHLRYNDNPNAGAWDVPSEWLQCLCETCHQIAHMPESKVIANAERAGFVREIVFTISKMNRSMAEFKYPAKPEMRDAIEWLKIKNAELESEFLIRIRPEPGQFSSDNANIHPR